MSIPFEIKTVKVVPSLISRQIGFRIKPGSEKKGQFGLNQLLLSVLFISFILMIFINNSWAQVVDGAIVINEKKPSMRLEGSHTFTVTPRTETDSITWRVNRSVNNTLKKNVFTSNGESATFNLIWKKGNTTYTIKVKDGTSEDEMMLQVFPPDKGISYSFKNPYNKTPNVKVRVLVPGSLNLNTPLISVHHGSSRANYFSYWQNWGKKEGWVILAPHFPNSGKWAGSKGYNLGNMFSGKDGKGQLNHENQWAFRIAVDAATAMLEGFDLNDKTFDIWGHSAGGQFSHRVALFIRDASIRRCLPANPGWWTLPVYDKTKKKYKFPYGVYHPKLDYDQKDIDRFSAIKGFINAGNKDILRDSGLRITPEADAQGRNRWKRANSMFKVLKEKTTPTSWLFTEVKGVNHDGKKMAKAAQKWLVENPPETGPVADFTTSPISGEVPLEVNFDATASKDPNGTIVAYEWDFGDNAMDAGVTTFHRYDTPGTYQPKLTVTNNSGQTGTAIAKISVQDPSAHPFPPKNLEAIGKNGMVALNWSDNTEPDIKEYEIHRKVSGIGPFHHIESVIHSKYTDNSAINGTTYTYVVLATDTNNNKSEFSNETSATPSDVQSKRVAFDGFESKKLGGGKGWITPWRKKGDVAIMKKNPHKGKGYIRLRNKTGYLKRPLTATNTTNLRLSFWSRVKSFEKKDKALVKVSRDGKTYDTIEEISAIDSDGTWLFYNIDLSAYDNTKRLRIVFEAKMNALDDRWFIDDVEVLGVQ